MRVAAYAQGFHLRRGYDVTRRPPRRAKGRAERAKGKAENGKAEVRSQKAIDFPTMSDREEMDLVLLQVECVNDSIVAHSQTEPL